MTKKEKFIYIVDELFRKTDMPTFCGEDYDDVMTYWEALKVVDNEKEKPMFTDNGKLILKYLQEHQEESNMIRAKDIAEGLFISSRTVSGSIRKLVTDGYIDKIGQNPILYSLTDLGKTITIED